MGLDRLFDKISKNSLKNAPSLELTILPVASSRQLGYTGKKTRLQARDAH